MTPANIAKQSVVLLWSWFGVVGRCSCLATKQRVNYTATKLGRVVLAAVLEVQKCF